MTRQARLEALGAHIANEEEPLVHDEADHRRVRGNLLAAVPSRPRPRRRALTYGIAIAAVVMAATVWFLRPSPGTPLGFFVGSGRAPGVLGEFVAATDAPVPVGFTDGTHVVFEPGARGRVVTTDATGASVVVEAGRARVSVVPRSGNRWEVSVGPFVVQVTGTRFDVEWHPDRDSFVLELREGHVRVAGCAFGEGQPVNPGERVEASCKQQAFRVSRIDEIVTAEPSQPLPPSAVVQPDAPEAPPAMPVQRVPPAEDWRVLTQQGRFAEGYRAVATHFGDVCDHGGAAEVILLGDAARLSGHVTEARRAYQCARDRFAGTPTAALGAFQIGRVDFDQRGDHRSAERWLSTYLGEEPSGMFAAAAMGRLIEAEVHLGQIERARTIARQYLEQFPKGPHAETAHRVLAAAARTSP